jgi:hypothetical protein
MLALILTGVIAATGCGSVQPATPSYEAWVMTFTPDEWDFPDGTVYQSYAISGDWIVSATPTITIPDPPLDSVVMWWTSIFHNTDHSQSAIGCAAGASVY